VSNTSATTGLTSLPTAEQLPDDAATLKSMLLEVLATLHQRDRDNQALRHRVEQLLRRLYGPRSERFHPDQPLLFADLTQTDLGAAASAAASPTEVATPTKPRRRCRPHGRRRLPEHLPRQTVHHTLAEAARLCPGCGQLRQDIGVDKSEQLDYRPASLQVIEHLVHKYACPHCCRPQPASPAPDQDQEPATMPSPQRPAPASQPAAPPAPPPPASVGATARGATVIAAAKPPQPIAKGLPGPGLLAHLIVSKYVDHLPLYRLERIYQRQGLLLPRSTLCDWLAACAQSLRPLYDLLSALILESRALHTDDTPIKLQNPSTHTLSTARLWIYVGDAAHPYNVFDFTVTRQRDGPQLFLADYAGYLHADAFSGYECLYLPVALPGTTGIREVACNAHARRKFYEARTSDALHAHQALGYYRQLYALERPAADFTEEQRLQMRQDLAVPVLEQFHTWLKAQRAEVLPKSPMGEAIGYALNNWSALIRYTEAGFLTIDNNVAEREMKRIAIGRKNWLFVGSEQGGQTAAVLFSFASTCQRLQVEPWAYLQDVLTRLPTTPPEQLAALLPDRWQAARQAAASPPPPSPDQVPPSD
jgi:transposase